MQTSMKLLDEQIFVMAASNTPWDLDIALLRRLEKRVYVPLPEEEARGMMLRKHLSDRCVDIDTACSEIAGLTAGYSGADIELLCREAAMKPVRRLMIRLSQLEAVNSVPLPPNPRNSRTSLRCTDSVDISSMLKADPVSLDDIISALESTKSSSSNAEFSRYENWQKEYGAV
jgi:katanin p60 ATPase-containing subunit A1